MVGENIKNIRESKKITQKDLADMAEISVKYLNMIEKSKKKNPSLEVLGKIANALNCQISELTKDTNTNDNTIPKVNKDISIDIKSIIKKINNGETGPVNFEGEPIAGPQKELVEDTLKFIMKTLKTNNKEK